MSSKHLTGLLMSVTARSLLSRSEAKLLRCSCRNGTGKASLSGFTTIDVNANPALIQPSSQLLKFRHDFSIIKPLFGYKVVMLDTLKSIKVQHFSTTRPRNCENEENDDENDNEKEGSVKRDPAKDRSKKIPVEVSMKYMESEAYRIGYGDEPVWVKYRRNFKGQFAPKLTRKSCIKNDMLNTGNPCPICRDEYLVVDYRNTELLKQFISPFTDEVLPWSKTNVCRTQHWRLEAAIEKARQHGLLTFYIPFRNYKYEDYYDFSTKTSRN